MFRLGVILQHLPLLSETTRNLSLCSWPLCQAFEYGTSQMQSRNANHLTTLFNIIMCSLSIHITEKQLHMI